jgi:hypothetical protein
MSQTPYYYAPGGRYVLFLDLLGFTAFVRSSFQKKAEETDDREKEFELAQRQFKIAQAEVGRRATERNPRATRGADGQRKKSAKSFGWNGEPGRNRACWARPQAEAHLPEAHPAKTDRAQRDLVSREGIEPSTRRLRVCCSAN